MIAYGILAVLIATLGAACAGESTDKQYVYFTHENIICQDGDVENACDASTVAFAKCLVGEPEDFTCTVSGWGSLFEDQGLEFVPTLIFGTSTLVHTIKRKTLSDWDRQWAPMKRESSAKKSSSATAWYQTLPPTKPTAEKSNSATAWHWTAQSTANATADALPKATSRAEYPSVDYTLLPQYLALSIVVLAILAAATIVAEQFEQLCKAIPIIAYDRRKQAWCITFAHHIESANAMHRAVGLVVLACFANLIASGSLVYEPSVNTLTLYCAHGNKTKKEETVAAADASGPLY
jgi:hypothetical protein